MGDETGEAESNTVEVVIDPTQVTGDDDSAIDADTGEANKRILFSGSITKRREDENGNMVFVMSDQLDPGDYDVLTNKVPPVERFDPNHNDSED